MRLRSPIAVLILVLAAASPVRPQPGLPSPAELERELGKRAAKLAAAQESGDLTAIIAESRGLSALLLRLIAHIELAQGLPGEASESLRQSVAVEPDPMTAYALGTLLLRRDEKAEARAVFDRLLAGAGGRAELHLLIGNAYAAAAEVREAIRELEAAAAGNPALLRAHLNLASAHLLLNAGQSTPATLDALRAALAVDPTSYEANYYLSHLESLEKRYTDAAVHLRAAAAARPRSADPRLQLGLNAFAAGDLEAERLLLEGVALAEKHGEDMRLLSRAFGALSRIAAARGDLEAGARYFARARELGEKPADDPPAETPPASGVDEARLAALRERRQGLADVLARVFTDWGTAAARGGDPAEALRRYRDAERWNPKTPLLMRNLGLAALAAGDFEEGVRALTAAAAADPQDRSLPSLQAVALFSAKRWAEAASVFEGLGDALFENPRMAYMWAASLARSGAAERARKVLERLRALPLPPPALRQLGELYREMGDDETAGELLREAEARERR
jgi:predicted Zn-dependent protease